MVNNNQLDQSQDYDDWLEDVLDELGELGHTRTLTEEERDWLYDIWDNYPMSPAEAAQSFINEMPA